MRERIIRISASSAVVTAGMCAGVFGGLFFIFLVSSILLVGDGTGPWVTNFSSEVIEFTVKLLGFHREGNLLVVIIFWSSVVFVFMFAIFFPIKMAATSATENLDNQGNGNTLLIIVLVLIAILLFIYYFRSTENATIEEEHLALDYVTKNNQVIKLVGGPVKANISSTSLNWRGGRYEFTVYPDGKSISDENYINAIVEVSRSWGKPTFILACIPRLSQGMRDPYKDPCQQ